MRTIIAAALSAFLATSLCAQELFDQTQVRDMFFTFKQASWWTLLQQSRSTGQDLKADLKFDNVTYTDVGVRVKGASSSSSVSGNKKPFNLTMDSFVPGQNLLGFNVLNLNNGAYDPTLTREVMAYEVYRNFIPAPRTTYIRVHLNNTYWGIYILIEQPSKVFLRDWFRDEDGTRYKGDRPSGAAVNTSTLNWFGASTSNYTSRYEIKTPNHPSAWTDLVTMIDKLNNLSTAQFEQEIVKYINVDRALWYLAVNNVVINSDDYMGAGHNYYMYFDPLSGQMNMIPWDNNEAYGVHGPSFNPHLYSITQGSTSSNRPLTRRLLAVPVWRELYFAHYRTVLRSWTDWNTVIGPLNTRFQNLIRADVQRDTNYLFSMAQFDPNLKGSFRWGGHTVYGLRDLVIARRGYLLTQSVLTKPEPQFSGVSFSPAPVKTGQKVQVTIKVTGSPAIRTVVLRSTTRGIYTDDPMFDDGMHGDGKANDGIYGGTFTAGDPGLPTRFYVHATDTAGTVQVHPASAEHVTFEVPVTFPDPTGSIVINEVLADNDTGDRDQNGEFEDWFEVYNRSRANYDLSGHYLSDDVLTPKKWKVPANTVVPGGGYLRFWADDQTSQGVDHVNFKLRKAGEMVVLHDTDARNNKLLDGLAFDQQKADRSFGRLPDGGIHQFFLWTPSGGAPVTGTGLGRAVRFDRRRTGAPSGFDLLATGLPQATKVLSLDLEGGPANRAAILALSLRINPFDLGALGPLIIDPGLMLPVALTLDVNGKASLQATVPSGAAGATLYAQAIATELSNALIIRISK